MSEVNALRADINRKANTRKRMKKAFTILLIAEAVGLVISGVLFLFT